ncbi:hypothetical protein [Leptospira levettii]|uniref:hypothetical protein n=1 Tax=Leptospira levettii TaxID=2023178 RepID=UPI001082B494|nr:hypothetical protein [Leptospira levettii]TGM28234.1 hypothetical protein EHQ74_02305 [Leptospira levettii]
MKITETVLKDFRQTIKEIFRLSRDYHTDLLYFDKEDLIAKSPKEFFDWLQGIEYIADPDGIEVVQRPKILFDNIGTNRPFDCDDRTVLCLSYFILQNKMRKIFSRPQYETRVCVIGRGERPHHVHIEYKLENETEWKAFDPTYPRNKFNEFLFVPGFYECFYEKDFLSSWSD